MEAMLETGAFDANARDDDRATPAHYAAAKGHADIITRLAAAGANARACDVRGATPLHYAAGGGHAEAVDALASPPVRADPNAADATARTPAHYAAARGATAAVRALLRHGANPLFESADGTTPRDDAVAHGWTAAADALGKAASATGTGGAPELREGPGRLGPSLGPGLGPGLGPSLGPGLGPSLGPGLGPGLGSRGGLAAVPVVPRPPPRPVGASVLPRRRGVFSPASSAASSPASSRPSTAGTGEEAPHPYEHRTRRGEEARGGEEVSASGASSGSAARGAGFRAGVPLSAPDAFAGRRATLPPLPSEETLSKPMPALVGSARDAVAAPPRKREDSKAAFLSRYGLDKTPGLFRVDE